MAVAYKASGADPGTTIGGTNTYSYPAGWAAGDFGIIIQESGNVTIDVPSGWTELFQVGVGAGNPEIDVDATRIIAFGRFFEAGDSGSVTITATGPRHQRGRMASYTGVDTTTPFTVGTGKTEGTGSTSISTNSIAAATGDGDCLFLAIYGTDRDSYTPSISSSSFAGVSATATTRFVAGTGSNGGGGYALVEGDPSADATGAVSHSATLSQSTIWASMLVRLNPTGWGAGGTTDGDGAASGTGAVSGTGASTAASPASAAGAGAASAVGASTTASLGAATGAGAATGTGESTAAGVGSSSGTGAVTGVGDTAGSTGSGDGAAAGTGAATGVGTGVTSAAGSGAGTGATSAPGASTHSAAGAASGTAAATAVGIGIGAGSGDATGTGAATGVGESTAASTGAAAGTSTANAAADGTTFAVGASSGTSTADGVGASTSTATGAATGVGEAAAVGLGVSTGAAVGAANGSGAATAVGASTAAAAGAAAGTSAADALTDGTAPAVGSADASGSVAATGAAVASTQGSASGTSTVTAAGATYSTGVALSAGFGVAVGTGSSIAEFRGIATGRSTAAAGRVFTPRGPRMVTIEAMSRVMTIGADMARDSSTDTESREYLVPAMSRVIMLEGESSEGGVSPAPSPTPTPTPTPAVSGVGAITATVVVIATGASVSAATGLATGSSTVNAATGGSAFMLGASTGVIAAVAFGASTGAGRGVSAGVGTPAAVGSTAPAPTPAPSPTPTPTPSAGDIFVEDVVAVALNYDPNLYLGTAGIPSSAYPDSKGAFRLTGNVTHISKNDPIVYPGQQGVAHSHTFWGNSAVDHNTTYETLRTTGLGSTEGNKINRTGKWYPSLMNVDDDVLIPDHITEYYKQIPAVSGAYYQAASPTERARLDKHRPWIRDENGAYTGARAVTVPIPMGMRYVSPGGTYHLFKNGVGTSYPTFEALLANAAVGDRFRLGLKAPPGWDGRRVDTADHVSHIMGTTWDGNLGRHWLPETHPFIMPSIEVFVFFTFTAEMGDLTQLHFSHHHMHFDYFEGWQRDILTRWHTHDINGFLNASSGNLGDGYKLNRPASFTFDQTPALVRPVNDEYRLIAAA